MLQKTEWNIEEVDVLTAHRLRQAGLALFVDVRETNEFEAERIPGAFLMPLSMFNGAHIPILADKTMILHCAVGKRSAAAAKQLLQSGHGRAVHMAGGLNAWKDAGLPTEV
ncbi:rhodanese-like domain-containing protein [Magnetospira thiophila]